MASRTSPPGTDSSPVVDIEDFVVESSVGWRNGSGQASPPVQYRQRDVGGISGGEGVDGPGGGGRSSFEVSVPQQRGDEQNDRGHDSLAQNDLGGEPNVHLLLCRAPHVQLHRRLRPLPNPLPAWDGGASSWTLRCQM